MGESVNIQKIIMLVALVIALVAAFTTAIPYDDLILAVLGAIVGFWIVPDEHVRVLVHELNESFIAGVAELIGASEEVKAAPQGLDPRTAAEVIVDSTRGMMIRAIADSSVLTNQQIRERQLAMLRTLWPLLFTRAAPAVALDRSTV